MQQFTVKRKVQILRAATAPTLKTQIIHKVGMNGRERCHIDRLVIEGLLDAYPVVGLKLSGPPNRHRMIYTRSAGKAKNF